MLASVPVGWLWLMAAAATVVACSAMGTWIPVRKFRIAFPVIIVGCGTGMVVYGRLSGYTLAGMLVLYSFALIGMTVGLFPTRKLFTMWAHEINRGVTRERYDYPRSHTIFFVAFLTVMLFAAALLTL